MSVSRLHVKRQQVAVANICSCPSFYVHHLYDDTLENIQIEYDGIHGVYDSMLHHPITFTNAEDS